MDTIKYRALLETIAKGSLTKAAQTLGYSQPGISHMIRALEREFGFALLQRGKDAVLPTEDAKKLLPYLRQIELGERSVLELAAKISGGEEGAVRIGAFYSVSMHWMPKVIGDFSQQYPGISIQLSEGNRGEVWKWLVQGEIDLGFFSAPVPEGFEFFPIAEDPVMAILPQNHPLCAFEKVPAELLIREPFLSPCEGADEEVLRVITEEGLPQPQIRYRIKGDETIFAMVEAGLGVTLMSRLLAEKTRADVQIRPLEQQHCRVLGIAARQGEQLSPAARRFLEAAAEQLQREYS